MTATDHPLFVNQIHEPTDAWVAGLGEVFAEFREQDSACTGLGVAIGDDRWFVKYPTAPRSAASLANAVAVHDLVTHSTIVPLRHWLSSPDGAVLIYPWVDGEALYGVGTGGGPAARTAPGSAHTRFRSLPVEEVVSATVAILDAHLVVAAVGLVAVDLYDGCLIYDFDRSVVQLIDLDHYHLGPFTVGADRLPGSTRFMAPEETTPGATVDERTTVFNLGRMLAVLLDEGDDEGRFRGSEQQLDLVQRATVADADRRIQTVAALAEGWSASRDRSR